MKAWIVAASLLVLTRGVLGGTVEVKQHRKPTTKEVDALKRLASQTVLHVETSLKKIEAPGVLTTVAEFTGAVVLPARKLRAEWSGFPFSDRVMFAYSGCVGALSDLEVYAMDAQRPPKYYLSDMALKKRQYIQEGLEQCKPLRSTSPSATDMGL